MCHSFLGNLTSMYKIFDPGDIKAGTWACPSEAQNLIKVTRHYQRSRKSRPEEYSAPFEEKQNISDASGGFKMILLCYLLKYKYLKFYILLKIMALFI